MADLGNAKGSYAPKASILPKPQGTETQPPKKNREVTGLTLYAWP